MKSLSLVVSYSDVKRLVYTMLFALFALTTLMARPALAADPAPGAGVTVNNSTPIPCGEGRRNKSGSLTECEDDPNYKIKECKTKEEEIRTEQKAMTSACSKAGLGANCMKKIQTCIDEDVTENLDPGVLEQALPLLNQALGTSVSMPKAGTTEKGCANKSERDYKDEKERIEREIKEAQTDLADVAKEIAEEKEALDKQMKEAQEDIAVAKKEMEEQKKNLSQESRDRINELSEQQQKTSQQVRELNTQILNKRAEITRYEREHGKRLQTMTQGLGRLKCLAQVQKQRDEMQKMGLFNTNGTGNFISQGNAQRKALQELYDTCTREFEQDRLKAMEDRQNYLKGAQNDLNNLQTTIDEANNALTSYNNQMQEAIKEIEKGKTTAENQVLEHMQRATAALQAAQATSQQKQQALAQKQTAAQARLAQLQADLGKMGPMPSTGATEGWRSAQSSVLDYAMARSTFCESECGATSKSICSSSNKAADQKVIKGSNK